MHISLLEDDAAQAAMVTRWLVNAGHNVRHFDTGGQFVDSLTDGRVDLMILDWELPDISGVEVLQQARAPQTPSPLSETHSF